MHAVPDYLEKVLNAQVYDVAIETPLELANNLSGRVGNKIILKREDMQPVFSFKLRGASTRFPPFCRKAEARRDLRLGRQPCPGCRTVSQQIGLPGRDRHADLDTGHQDRRGQVTRW
jgi:hypothetical protein